MPLICMMLLDDPNDQVRLTYFYNRNHMRLFRYAQSQFIKANKRGLYSRDQIEDLVSDCFVKIAENIEKFNEMEETDKLKWATVVLHNLVFDFFKREKQKAMYAADLTPKRAAAGDDEKLESWEYAELVTARNEKNDEVWNKLMIKRLKVLLSELPAAQRDLLEKRYILGYTNRQIAEMYHVPESTIATRLQRSRKNFKEILIEEGFEYV